MAEGGRGGIRGLLVDYGGVLTTDLFASFRAFCATEGLEPDAIVRGVRENAEARELMVALETGEIDEDAFEPAFGAILGVADPLGLIARLMGGASPDPAMLDAVRAVHAAGVPTGLLSNSWGTRRYDRALLAELFDGVVISGEVGLRKPTPRIYELGAEAIGVPAAACVFVDDLEGNLEPAAALGMATIHHTSAAETVPRLEALLGVPIA